MQPDRRSFRQARPVARSVLVAAALSAVMAAVTTPTGLLESDLTAVYFLGTGAAGLVGMMLRPR
jgi:hypothetical protein